MQGYLNFKAQRADGSFDCYQSITVEVKRELMPHHKAGLCYTATGYGKRIPTEYMVRHNGKWRRVYCCQYSNAGTCYIGKLGDYNGGFATFDLSA